MEYFVLRAKRIKEMFGSEEVARNLSKAMQECHGIFAPHAFYMELVQDNNFLEVLADPEETGATDVRDEILCILCMKVLGVDWPMYSDHKAKSAKILSDFAVAARAFGITVNWPKRPLRQKRRVTMKILDPATLGHTPNWNLSLGQRATSVTISVKIRCDGRGLSRQDVSRLCLKFEKTAKGRSQNRQVSAIC